MPENLRTREDDLRAWLSISISRGWVSEPYCSAHDQPLITDAERAEMRARDQDEWDMEMLDRCQTSVRVFQDAPAPPDSNPEVCPICRGAGYLLDQGYGYSHVPFDSVPVQRCDACDRYPGDIEAATAAAKDLGTCWGADRDEDGNIKPVTDPEGGEFPGDAWVRIPRDDAGLPVIPLPLVSPEAITATQRLCHEYGARGVRNIIDALVRRGEA